MDMGPLRSTSGSEPDFAAARDRILAAAQARMTEISPRGPVPSASREPHRAEPAAVPDPDTELEKQLAASERARAELVAKLNQAEQALAMTQLSLLNAERRAREAETHLVEPREDPAPSRSAPVPSPHTTTVAPDPVTVEVSPDREPGPTEPDDESALAPSSLLSRISALRNAVESAAEELVATPADNDDVRAFRKELEAAPADNDDVPTFRERLARAADARHRAASS